MAERKITLVEYHSHGDGTRLFPDLLQRGTSETPSDETEEEERVEEDGGLSKAPIYAIIGLIVVAAAYRYYRSREQESKIASEQVEVTEYSG